MWKTPRDVCFYLAFPSLLGEGGSRRLTDEVYLRPFPPRDASLRSSMTRGDSFRANFAGGASRPTGVAVILG